MKNKQEAIFALIGAIFFALLFAIFLIGGIINILVPVIKITLIQIINQQYNLFDNSIILGLYGGCYFIFVCWIIGLCILGRYYFILFKKFHYLNHYNDKKEVLCSIYGKNPEPKEEKEIPTKKQSNSKISNSRYTPTRESTKKIVNRLLDSVNKHDSCFQFKKEEYVK